MKILSISSYLNRRVHCTFHRKIQIHLYRSRPYPTRSSRRRTVSDPLYSRISHLGDPNISLVPTLDQWIAEGNSTHKLELLRIINELRAYGRFKHALEVSLWMTNKRNFPVSPFDIATRLKLIYKTLGLEQAEKYFNKIPENLRTHHAYVALLNCYALDKSVDKAEYLMQKVRDLGYATKPIWYNLMMNMYNQLGDRQKTSNLLMEMEAKGILYDQFTVSLCIKAYVEDSDAKGIDRMMTMMEGLEMKKWSIGQWQTPVIAAQGYLTLGLTDKALAILDTLERQLKACRQKDRLFVLLFKLYANAGNKDRLFRAWNLYQRSEKPVSKVYMGMMRALRKLGDVEGMERVYGEWESCMLQYDFRVANSLIEVYCARGDMERAEALIAKGISKGGDPFLATWCQLARGYLANSQLVRAMDALKKAISVCPSRFVSCKVTLVSCLERLERRDENPTAKVEELIKSMRSMHVWREDDSCGSIKEEGIGIL